VAGAGTERWWRTKEKKRTHLTQPWGKCGRSQRKEPDNKKEKEGAREGEKKTIWKAKKKKTDIRSRYFQNQLEGLKKNPNMNLGGHTRQNERKNTSVPSGEKKIRSFRRPNTGGTLLGQL